MVGTERRMEYDLVVVGAGLAGLWTAIRYLETHPTHRVCIMEREKGRVGGRVLTHYESVPGPGHGMYQWEAGAGRIPDKHHRVIRMIRRYGLTYEKWGTSPLEGFSDVVNVYLAPLESLGSRVLGQLTLGQVLEKVYGRKRAQWSRMFPYWAEFQTLRADRALEALLRGALSPGTVYGWCVEGLSELVKRMSEDVVKRGGVIRQGTLLAVEWVKGAVGEVGAVRADTGTVFGHRVVVAIPATAMRHVKGLKSLEVLRHLRSEPLIRVYAVFPIHGGASWFTSKDRRVVDGPIRFFIPMNAERGLAMISYTEGADARYWLRLTEGERTRAIMTEIRQLFPDRVIPDPLRVRYHVWSAGCTYWTPGKYDVVKASETSLQPFPGRPLYLCGESFALEQAWMESALEQADRVLARMS